jgi:hypothetical protein
MKVSKEVRKLDGKEGDITDIARQYLDIKKVNYSIIEEYKGKSTLPKDKNSFFEPGSIIIGNDEKKVIIEPLHKVCGISTSYTDTDKKVRVRAALDRISRLMFVTYKDKKKLNIYTNVEIREPIYASVLGDASISVTMEDVLNKPSKIPDIDEMFEINCKCENEKLKCRGHAWEY